MLTAAFALDFSQAVSCSQAAKTTNVKAVK